MNGFNAYSLYQAIKLHFSGSYDAIKYGFKTRVKQSTYEARRDRYFYEKIASKIQRQDDLVKYYVANFVYQGTSIWIGDMNEEHLDTLNTRLDTFTYRIVNRIKGFPLSFDEMFQGDDPMIMKAEIEVQVVLNALLNFTQRLRKRLSDPLAIYSTRFDLIENYQPFLLSWVELSRVKQGIQKALAC